MGPLRNAKRKLLVEDEGFQIYWQQVSHVMRFKSSDSEGRSLSGLKMGEAYQSETT